MLRFRAASRTAITRPPRRLPPLGAKRAVSRIRYSISSGTGSSVNSLIAALSRSASDRSMCLGLSFSGTGRLGRQLAELAAEGSVTVAQLRDGFFAEAGDVVQP